MVVILTQNKALLNFNSNSIISVSMSEDNDKAMVVIDNAYILGLYDTVEIASEVILWIAESIGAHKSDDNICLTMPFITNEVVENAENNRSDNIEQDTEKV